MCVLGRFWVARDGNLVPRNVSKGGISYNALWAQGQEVSLRKSRSQGTLSICQLCFFSGFFLHFSLCLSSIQQTFTEISLDQFLTSSATARVKHNSRVIPRPIIQNACSWGTVWQVEGGGLSTSWSQVCIHSSLFIYSVSRLPPPDVIPLSHISCRAIPPSLSGR